MLTTTPTTTPVLRHADDCTGPLEYLTTGRFGDTLVRCRNCHGWALAKAEPVPPPEPVQNARRPPRGDLVVPPCPFRGRDGDRWPTHRGKRRNAPRADTARADSPAAR